MEELKCPQLRELIKENRMLAEEAQHANMELDRVTAERDGWREVHRISLENEEVRRKDREAEHVQRLEEWLALTAERDALRAEVERLREEIAMCPNCGRGYK